MGRRHGVMETRGWERRRLSTLPFIGFQRTVTSMHPTISMNPPHSRITASIGGEREAGEGEGKKGGR